MPVYPIHIFLQISALDPNIGSGQASSVIRYPYLSLDVYLQDGSDDGQCVADNDEDVPPVDKLQLI